MLWATVAYLSRVRRPGIFGTIYPSDRLDPRDGTTFQRVLKIIFFSSHEAIRNQ